MTRDPTGALYGAAGVLALAGVLLRVLPAPVPAAELPAASAGGPSERAIEPEQAQRLLAYEEIVATNVFAAERQPPRVRYAPPGAPAAVAPGSRPPAVRLLGIATGPTGAVALIDADPAFPGAENYRVGDRVGDARLVAIDDSSVVLVGAGGRRVLTLPSARRMP